MPFTNSYDDAFRSRAYDTLEFPGTYYLAYRDLPAIFREYVRGTKAVDFGCGTGRSTRFLRGLGFAPIGLDISAPMLAKARERDPDGDYHLVVDGETGDLPAGAFDLVFSGFTFDNVPTMERKVALFSALRRLLTPHGRIVMLGSTPEIYLHEWASFSTKDFPENRVARCGDVVRTIMLDVEDRRPVDDVLWPDEAYREVFARAELSPLAVYHPLGSADEPYAWVTETTVPPWVIYVLAPNA